jgi:hypothetical protein
MKSQSQFAVVFFFLLLFSMSGLAAGLADGNPLPIDGQQLIQERVRREENVSRLIPAMDSLRKAIDEKDAHSFAGLVYVHVNLGLVTAEYIATAHNLIIERGVNVLQFYSLINARSQSRSGQHLSVEAAKHLREQAWEQPVKCGESDELLMPIVCAVRFKRAGLVAILYRDRPQAYKEVDELRNELRNEMVRVFVDSMGIYPATDAEEFEIFKLLREQKDAFTPHNWERLWGHGNPLINEIIASESFSATIENTVDIKAFSSALMELVIDYAFGDECLFLTACFSEKTQEKINRLDAKQHEVEQRFKDNSNRIEKLRREEKNLNLKMQELKLQPSKVAARDVSQEASVIGHLHELNESRWSIQKIEQEIVRLRKEIEQLEQELSTSVEGVRRAERLIGEHRREIENSRTYRLAIRVRHTKDLAVRAKLEGQLLVGFNRAMEQQDWLGAELALGAGIDVTKTRALAIAIHHGQEWLVKLLLRRAGVSPFKFYSRDAEPVPVLSPRAMALFMKRRKGNTPETAATYQRIAEYIDAAMSTPQQ